MCTISCGQEGALVHSLISVRASFMNCAASVCGMVEGCAGPPSRGRDWIAGMSLRRRDGPQPRCKGRPIGLGSAGLRALCAPSGGCKWILVHHFTKAAPTAARGGKVHQDHQLCAPRRDLSPRRTKGRQGAPRSSGAKDSCRRCKGFHVHHMHQVGGKGCTIGRRDCAREMVHKPRRPLGGILAGNAPSSPLCTRMDCAQTAVCNGVILVHIGFPVHSRNVQSAAVQREPRHQREAAPTTLHQEGFLCTEAALRRY